MERAAYSLLHNAEGSWWYRARAKAVVALASRAGVHPAGAVLDYGAGYGGMERVLSAYGAPVAALEPDDEARAVARTRGYGALYADEQAAFATRYGCIGLFDVVEHIEDDAAFLARARGALIERGVLLISVPAFPFLWSTHDVAHHHYRRYTKASLERVLAAQGYTVLAISYWNALLFPPAALMRLFGLSGESGLALPAYLNAFFSWVVGSEAHVLCHFPLPFGTGIIAVARKHE